MLDLQISVNPLDEFTLQTIAFGYNTIEIISHIYDRESIERKYSHHSIQS